MLQQCGKKHDLTRCSSLTSARSWPGGQSFIYYKYSDCFAIAVVPEILFGRIYMESPAGFVIKQGTAYKPGDHGT